MKIILLLAFSAAAAPLDSALARLDALIQQENNKPANEIRALDARIGALEPAFVKAGPDAAAPLFTLAKNTEKPLKQRVWAVNFLALLADPAAFEPLSALALDKSQPEIVRAQAFSALDTTGVGDAALRRRACAGLAQEDLPPEVLREALLVASRVGCDEPALLAHRAKDQGSRPSGAAAPLLADLAIRGLGRSHPAAAAQELFGLFDFYRKATPERGLTLVALRKQSDNLKIDQSMAARRACEALSEEAETPSNAVAALRLLVALNARACAPGLLRALKNADAEVVAEDAEALSALGLTSAIGPLGKILDGAIADERFAPRPWKPAPTDLIDRIQRALIRLR